MFKLICVTNKKMCADFLTCVGELHKNGITVILREKDLSESEYEHLARDVLNVCPDAILHTYADAAKRLGVRKIHMPLPLMNENIRNDFETVGVSVHSPEEAVTAEKMGADYVIAGHVFETDCKKNLAPRGLEYLKNVISAVNIPVYAIGGITPDNIALVREAGAAGVCVMSGFMRCGDIRAYARKLK